MAWVRSCKYFVYGSIFKRDQCIFIWKSFLKNGQYYYHITFLFEIHCIFHHYIIHNLLINQTYSYHIHMYVYMYTDQYRYLY